MTVRELAGMKISRCKKTRVVQSLVQRGDGRLEICCAISDDASCVDIYTFAYRQGPLDIVQLYSGVDLLPGANDRSTVVDCAKWVGDVEIHFKSKLRTCTR